MAFLGRGVLAIWHDYESDDEDDFQNWYTREHFPERLGVPGFLRGRRYVTAAGGREYAALYETESAQTLASAPYRARLRDPTPWSSRVLAGFRNTHRTACRVEASLGFGVGSVLASIWLAPAAGRAGDLKAWLTGTALPGALNEVGVVGAHLCVGAPEFTRVDSEEALIRGQPDEIADWIVLVEGHDLARVDAACARHLSVATLGERGGQDISEGRYRLLHSAVAGDASAFPPTKAE